MLVSIYTIPFLILLNILFSLFFADKFCGLCMLSHDTKHKAQMPLIKASIVKVKHEIAKIVLKIEPLHILRSVNEL